MTDIVERLNDSLSAGYSELRKEAAVEIMRLRAKITEMERQEPVAWQTRTRPAWNDGTWGPWRKCSKEYAEDIKKTPSLHDWLYEARALYALPGAQTQLAPSVPEGWLQHAARMAALARKLREPDWHFESIREMQRELCALEEAAIAAAPKLEGE